MMNGNDSTMENAPALTAPTSIASTDVGVIYPALEMRTMIDKTAQFVARNGPEFEHKILANETGKSQKFNFLIPTDIYYAYYKKRVKDFSSEIEKTETKNEPPVVTTVKDEESLEKEAPLKNQSDDDATAVVTVGIISASATVTKSQRVHAAYISSLDKQSHPPTVPFEHFIIPHPKINAVDLDVIKLTAQFAARNGKSFIQELSGRESRSAQFDFLKPSHALWGYFAAILESYSKCMLPSSELLTKVRSFAEGVGSKSAEEVVVDVAEQIVSHQLFQAENRRTKEARSAGESDLLRSIDWQDFVVVETIDFDPAEDGDLPVPFSDGSKGTLGTGAHSDGLDGDSQDQRAANRRDDDDDMDVDMDEEDNDVMDSEKARLAREIADEGLFPVMNIRKDYNRESKASGAPGKPGRLDDGRFLTQLCPVCHREIPVNDMQEHIRLELLDPKWREQREMLEKRKKDSQLSSGMDISANLSVFARQRFDVDDDVHLRPGQAAKPALEDAVTKATIGPKAAPAKLSLEEQIAAIHAARGGATANTSTKPSEQLPGGPRGLRLPPPSALRPPSPPPPPPPEDGDISRSSISQRPVSSSNMHTRPVNMEVPEAKRTKIGDDDDGVDLGERCGPLIPDVGLIPAVDFIAKNPGALSVNVVCPPADTVGAKPEWGLSSQTLVITGLTAHSSINDLKALIAKELGNMPPAKMKLKVLTLGITVTKDGSSLADNNIGGDSCVGLAIKTRGGR